MKNRILVTGGAALLLAAGVAGYPYETAEPQKQGWPLTAEERAYVLIAESERRPGSEQNRYLPELWPVVPSAGYWSGSAWLDTHAKLVGYVKENQGPVDVLLVGDSITAQWGGPMRSGTLNQAWKKSLGELRTVNIGIGGDKAQNVLWRLDHGGVDGLAPRVVLLMIGNNNMFFTPETGVEAAALGVKACVDNLRRRFPGAVIVVTDILPAHAPGVRFYEDIKKTNAEIDKLQLELMPDVHRLTLWNDFVNPDGTIRAELFTNDKIHLSMQGYEVYAGRLKPLFDRLQSAGR